MDLQSTVNGIAVQSALIRSSQQRQITSVTFLNKDFIIHITSRSSGCVFVVYMCDLLQLCMNTEEYTREL